MRSDQMPRPFAPPHSEETSHAATDDAADAARWRHAVAHGFPELTKDGDRQKWSANCWLGHGSSYFQTRVGATPEQAVDAAMDALKMSIV